MPNDNATMTRALVCVYCGGQLNGRQRKYCDRNKCQADKARKLTEYRRDLRAQNRRKQFQEEIRGRVCQGCGDPLGPEYRRGAQFHGDPCRSLANAKRGR